MGLHALYIGNFRAEHSTENHVMRALRNIGVMVTPRQEDEPETFHDLGTGREHVDYTDIKTVDFILWTRTGWDWERIYPGGERQALADQRKMLRRARLLGVPVIGFHLDIWWGLKRVHQVETEPFFESTIVITADGGHDEEWKSVGVNHCWMPPGVSELECAPGFWNGEYASPVAFVGSWQGGYHKESEHRAALIKWLKKNYPNDCEFYPLPGHHAVRGSALRDLYASVSVVVGDSCFTGTGLANYWSDRIPETLGRGGVLLHPYVPGLENHFQLGEDLVVWEAGDWGTLRTLIDELVKDRPHRELISRHGRERVLRDHTYEVRMRQLITLLVEKGLV